MRAKWSAPIRKYWKISEQMMVKYCDLAICDSVNIEKYIHECYDGKGIKEWNMDTIICKDPNMCTGCTACASICPKQCITMKENNEGFLYPEKELYKCIDCGLCNKVCPINRPLQIAHDLPRTFVVRTKNRYFLEKCTSGGVFTTLAWQRRMN